MAEQARHPLLSLRDEIDRLFEDFSLTAMRAPFRTRLFDFEPLRRFESAFSGAVPTAEVAEKDNEFVVTSNCRKSTRITSISTSPATC